MIVETWHPIVQMLFILGIALGACIGAPALLIAGIAVFWQQLTCGHYVRHSKQCTNLMCQYRYRGH